VDHLAHIACPTCTLVHEHEELEAGYIASCSRCGCQLSLKSRGDWQIPAAFTLCALLLYVPANIFPILQMTLYGRTVENTVFTGVVRFYEEGDWFVAAVIFLASILVPFLKILGLCFLILSSRFRWMAGMRFRTKLYHAIEALGRWAMVDVFALAILISLIKMQKMANVIPGPGAFAFTLVVIFTILASATFDPQTIWESADE
jgi:paraquat-inducible protein A